MSDRPSRHLLHAGIAAILLLAVLLASPPARRFYRANEARHLLNANDFVGALEAYQRLVRHDTKAAERLWDFPQQVAGRARTFYLNPNQRGVPPDESFEKMVRLLEQNSAGAEGRRLQLAVYVSGNQPTTASTQAALSILSSHDLGPARDMEPLPWDYDPEALWWATIGEYDPLKPLQTPQVLLRFRGRVEDALAQESDERNPAWAKHLYLGALIAIADGDWARASRLFDRYRRQADQLAPHELAYSVALMRSGQPQAAIPVLREYRERKTDLPLIDELLAEAFLAAGDFPWAADQARRVRQRAPDGFSGLLARIYPDVQTAQDPIVELACTLDKARYPRRNMAFWTWLDSIAEDESQRAAVREAAHRLAERGFDNYFDAASVLQFALREKDAQLLTNLPQSLPLLEETDRRRANAFERIINWYPRRDDAASTGPAFAEKPALLLSRGTTQVLPLKLPAGVSMLIVMIQGYPADGLWPLLHLKLDEQGARLYDAHSSKATAPLVFLLDRPLAQSRELRLTISLINGGETGLNTPSALIADIYGF